LDNSVWFEMQTYQFGLVILNLTNNLVRFSSIFILNRTMSILILKLEYVLLKILSWNHSDGNNFRVEILLYVQLNFRLIINNEIDPLN